MYQAFEHCNQHRDAPKASDSLASMCWPIIQQNKPLTVLEKAALSRRPAQEGVSWPVAEPWRRNIGQPRCGGKGRCQGDAERCDSKYRYGVDDVGPCPSDASCKNSYTCGDCPRDCPNPCPQNPGCNRQDYSPTRTGKAKRVFPVDSTADRIDLYDPIQACDPRLTTRCFNWPLPIRDKCAPQDLNTDLRPRRVNLHDQTSQPERCPTCNRTVVDMACGPLGYNY